MARKNWIKNKTELSTSPERDIVLQVIEAGLDAIDTESVMLSNIHITNESLKIKDHVFDLSEVDNIYVIGFGKASCSAAATLDGILGKTIKGGVAIGLAPTACEYIDTYGGSHPHPSVQNVEVSEKIVELSKKLTDKDLVIVIVSGGGSALLCWPMKECEQAQRLYQDFLKTGGDIKELNTIRKHISMLKGGGLAKELYPATVVGLIFSDVPGDHYELIASGPTYKDISTMGDAQAILDKYNLSGYELNETPTDDKYFERVTNIPLVSNLDALDAMRQEAERLRIKSKILSAELYDSPQQVVQQFMKAVEPGCILVGGGEPEVIVTKTGGRGGRSQKLGLEMLTYLTDKDVFAAVASDGLDNSPLAGVIEDQGTLEKAKAENVSLEDHIESWDSQGFYEKTGHELLQTGPTEANVSDLMIFYRKD